MPRRSVIDRRGSSLASKGSSSSSSTGVASPRSPVGDLSNPEKVRARSSIWRRRSSAYSSSVGRERRVTWVEAGTIDVPDEDRCLADTKESLRDHVFNVAGNVKRRFVITRQAALLLDAATLLLFILLMAGCTMPSFRMEVWGVVGVAMDFGREGSRGESYSIFDVSGLIMSQAESGNARSILGLYWIALIFVICALFVPLLQCFCLSVMWSRPMTIMQQKKLVVINEIVSAWQYLEVYLIAIVVAVLQIGQISGFMVGDLCNDLKATLDQLRAAGIIESRDAQCFYVHASVERGCYILLGAAVVLNCLSRGVISAAHAAIEDREERIKGWKFPENDEGVSRSMCFRSIIRIFVRFAIRDLTVMDEGETNIVRKQSVISLVGWETMWHHGKHQAAYLNLRTGEMQFEPPTATTSGVLKTRESTLRKQMGRCGVGRDPLSAIQSALRSCGCIRGAESSSERHGNRSHGGLAKRVDMLPKLDERAEEL